MRIFKSKADIIVTAVCGFLAVVIMVVAIVGNVLAFGKYSNVLISFFGMEGSSVENYDTDQYFDRHAANAQQAATGAANLGRTIVAEGSVLIKNENDALPLGENAQISCFSQSSVDFIYGSTGGSGAIGGGSRTTLKEALESQNFGVNPTLWNFYVTQNYHRTVGGLAQGVSYYEAHPFRINEVPYSKYTDEVKESYKKYNDAAIVVIARTGCENGDMPRSMSGATNGENTGSILELDQNERDMLAAVSKEFDKVVVLLNTSNPMELGFLEEYDIDACLWVGGVGEYGLPSVARILTGEVDPSGRLVDTYAYDVFSSPAMQNMGNFEFWKDNGNTETEHHYVTYSESIYVGYKYYETRYEDAVLKRGNAGDYDYDSVVQYPFGYGISYTDFAWSNYKVSEDDGKVTVTVDVKNTGDMRGKEVVQVYYQSPYTDYDKTNGVEKSAVELAGFAKTGIIEPGGSAKVTVTFDLEDMKSYDANGKGTYYLEGSTDEDKYYVTAAENAHAAINNILRAKGASVDEGDAAFVDTLDVDETVYDVDTHSGNKVENRFEDADGKKYYSDIKYLSRSDWSKMDNDGLRYGTLTGKDGSMDMEGYEYKAPISDSLIDVLETMGYAAAETPEKEFTAPKNGVKGEHKLIELKGRDFDDPAWEALLDQADLKEMVELARFSGYKTNAMVSVGKPYTTDADGPQAWNSFIGNGLSAGGLPYAIVIASTWDALLAEKAGYVMGELCLWSKMNEGSTNLTGWYAPAMNLHRTPFGGRNFEYYSECETLSAVIGSSVTKGATDRGVICYIKHFALNDQDRNRMTDNVTWAQEQSIRELYLYPFEVSIKDGGALGLMTSYNRIGTTWAGGSYPLLTGVLRGEWGFNGVVVSDYMDGNWENVDQMLAAGGDIALNSVDNDLTKCTSEGAQALTYLRRATHHVLYAIANSNAMNGINGATIINEGTPKYYKVMLGIDIGLGALFVIAVGMIPLKLFVLRGKKEEKKS